MPVSYTDQQIHDQAVHLGLIYASQELPRNLRSQVLATLVEAGRQQAGTPGDEAEPRLANEIVIQPGGSISIDGAPFPWVVAAEAMDIHLAPEPNGLNTVRLTLLASNVLVIRPEPRPESE